MRLQTVDPWFLWNDTGRSLSNLLEYFWLFSPLKRKNLLIFNFWRWFPRWCFCFLFPVWLIPVPNGGFDTQFEFSDNLFRLPIYHLLVSLLRPDCRIFWVLLLCLELSTKSEEPPDLVICALLLGTAVTLFHMIPGSSDDAHTLVLHKFGSSLQITMGHSTLDSASPDKFLEIPSYMLTFGEKD